jgi:quinol monooxygenase YgiN
MSVVVVARIEPKPGRLKDALDAFEAGVPLVHAEPGCELYAVHSDGATLFMIERWSSAAHLAAHSSGEALVRIGELLGDSLASPPAVDVLENVPFGQVDKGTIQ